MSPLKAIMIGDVIGEGGLCALEEHLPGLIKEQEADFTVVNGENAAGGFGLTEETLKRILAAGADAVTSGNHIWEKRDFWPVLDAETRVLRPANYPPGTPGRGWAIFEKKRKDGGSQSWLVLNLQGRERMPGTDCPFRCFDETLKSSTPGAVVLVDFHAESTREKEALAFYLDGRASVVAGTHTHVQTADERLLPGGTAYITDLGMTGVRDSIIGMDKKICLDRARTQVLFRMETAPAQGQKLSVQGIIAEIDGDTGRSITIRRI
jgi:metallophosphoesterase (TIGR00282 family)